MVIRISRDGSSSFEIQFVHLDFFRGLGRSVPYALCRVCLDLFLSSPSDSTTAKGQWTLPTRPSRFSEAACPQPFAHPSIMRSEVYAPFGLNKEMPSLQHYLFRVVLGFPGWTMRQGGHMSTTLSCLC